MTRPRTLLVGPKTAEGKWWSFVPLKQTTILLSVRSVSGRILLQRNQKRKPSASSVANNANPRTAGGFSFGAIKQNRSRITKYIFHFVPNLLSVLDHVSTVAKRHVSDFRFCTKAAQAAFFDGSHQKDHVSGLFMEPSNRIELLTFAFAYTSVYKK